MLASSKVHDIDNDNDKILVTKVILTQNEYYATILNKFEHNHLKLISKHINCHHDINACKLRTAMHDFRKCLNHNQEVICNADEFFMNRKVKFRYKIII
ncbi:unnamed protein product [Rotaria sp. Silwood1]|nr:unnamed protein product [Rotaria sp. Silwood1]CAF3470412.1 unnamed protein product [Rotaria sp. Silwood1]CAF3516857.1 unnamed protein product [Rotaria sp. Silwood1]CAF3539589.1 unnamed protein product [Rotaria sp. Silwood1]CAF4513237.1 unnamed protein product [Rotaria sp. Silwood1]